jgi:nucleotide-binding universal stress UspA family protein
MPFYRHIAVASAFSPRFKPLLAEAHRVARQCESQLTVLHAGERTSEAEAQFASAFAELGIPSDTPILTRPGEPADALLALVEEQKFDLLIAGALHKDLVRHFLGDVARALIRKARCSLLLFTNPVLEPFPFCKMVCVTDFSPLSREALSQTLFFATGCESPAISVARLFTVFSQAQARGGIHSRDRSVLEDEQNRLESWTKAIANSVPVTTKLIQGNTGFAASDYVQATGADLLVLPAGPPDAPHPFPRGMEWAADVIPSNLLVVRSPESRR